MPDQYVEEARSLFASAGLPFPPIPDEWLGGLRRIRKWLYSTRPLLHYGEDYFVNPYNIRSYIQDATAYRRRDYVLLAHAGHGVNSYAIHVYVVRGPLALLLQIPWGGVYIDNDAAITRMTDIFALAGELIQACRQARHRGRLEPGVQLLVIADLGGSTWTWVDRPISHEELDRIGGTRRGSWDDASQTVREALRAVQALAGEPC